MDSLRARAYEIATMVEADPSSKRKHHSGLPMLGGLRLTRQRQEVYNVLLECRDHPTVNMIFERVRERMPTISLATVYNCLEALVRHRLVNQVNFEREPSRYCPNLKHHGHFQNTVTGEVCDIHFKPGVELRQILDLPEGVCIEEVEITIRGAVLKSPLT